MEALCCHPLAKGPSAGAGGGAGAWVWLEAMAAHVGGSHPVAATVRAVECRRCLRVGVELFKDLVGELGQVGLEDKESVGP